MFWLYIRSVYDIQIFYEQEKASLEDQMFFDNQIKYQLYWDDVACICFMVKKENAFVQFGCCSEALDIEKILFAFCMLNRSASRLLVQATDTDLLVWFHGFLPCRFIIITPQTTKM